jgi:hypothetical protein
MTAPSLEPNLRFADPDESEAVARLINAAFVVERFFIDRDRTDPEKVRDLMGKGRFLLAEDDQRLAGCVQGIHRKKPQVAALTSLEAVDLRTVNLRAELPGFYRKLGYVETGKAPFVGDVEPSLPCHFVKMSKQLV